jgi:hypothetical protein
VFRRALESVDPGIQTIGFAGFFGLTAAHKGFASDVVEHRLPVLLNPGVHSTSEGDDPEADLAARFQARAKRAWGRFKLAAVSSFAFVEATGRSMRQAGEGRAQHGAEQDAPAARPPARPRARHWRDGGRGGDDPAGHVADREFRAAGVFAGTARTWSTTPLPAVCIAAPAAGIPAR